VPEAQAPEGAGGEGAAAVKPSETGRAEPKVETERPAGKNAAEIARIFKERFDGEIIEQDKEGKE
jgi:hypothetical protein